jgi:hypothetical protein
LSHKTQGQILKTFIFKQLFKKIFGNLFSLLMKTTKINFVYLLYFMFVFMVWYMLFNATFNNISVISWRQVLLVEETGARGENYRPVASD